MVEHNTVNIKVECSNHSANAFLNNKLLIAIG